jgi:TonB family protein
MGLLGRSGYGTARLGRSVSRVEPEPRPGRDEVGHHDVTIRLCAGPVTRPCVRGRGGLDKEIVRRVVRSHVKEIKFCYERELQRQPGLHGRVSVRFVIAPDGRVATVGITESSVENAGVERCVADAVARWEFPQARDGGVTFVTYPFVLQELGAY